MKKFFLILLFAIISFTASAQVLNLRTTGYTHKQYTAYGWTNWSRWENSDMLITINLNTDIIKIYSPKIQVYKIIDYAGSYTDRDGDSTIEYKFIDQDGDYGTLKLMQRRVGRSEIYIQFANVIWCYSFIIQ